MQTPVRGCRSGGSAETLTIRATGTEPPWTPPAARGGGGGEGGRRGTRTRRPVMGGWKLMSSSVCLQVGKSQRNTMLSHSSPFFFHFYEPFFLFIRVNFSLLQNTPSLSGHARMLKRSHPTFWQTLAEHCSNRPSPGVTPPVAAATKADTWGWWTSLWAGFKVAEI